MWWWVEGGGKWMKGDSLEEEVMEMEGGEMEGSGKEAKKKRW